MFLRILVLTVVLLILGAIGWFVGAGQAVACGITAVVIYVYAMARRFNETQAARRHGVRSRDDDDSAAMTVTMAAGSDSRGSGGADGGTRDSNGAHADD